MTTNTGITVVVRQSRTGGWGAGNKIKKKLKTTNQLRRKEGRKQEHLSATEVKKEEGTHAHTYIQITYIVIFIFLFMFWCAWGGGGRKITFRGPRLTFSAKKSCSESSHTHIKKSTPSIHALLCSVCLEGVGSLSVCAHHTSFDSTSPTCQTDTLQYCSVLVPGCSFRRESFKPNLSINTSKIK